MFILKLFRTSIASHNRRLTNSMTWLRNKRFKKIETFVIFMEILGCHLFFQQFRIQVAFAGSSYRIIISGDVRIPSLDTYIFLIFIGSWQPICGQTFRCISTRTWIRFSVWVHAVRSRGNYSKRCKCISC